MFRCLNNGSAHSRGRNVAAIVTAMGACAALSYASDTPVPLNYNSHIMAHPGEAIPGAAAANADSSTNYFRALADRGLRWDLTDPNCLGTLPIVGSTGGIVTSPFSYSLFNSLGYSNTTYANASTYGFDGIFIGNRALNFAGELLANPDSNNGPFPAWSPAVTVSSVAGGAGGLITATSTAHGLTAGGMVLVGGTIPALYNGPFVVASVPDANHFTYVNTTTSSASAQMFAENIAVSSMTQSGTTLTVNTASQHGFAVGQTINISGSLSAGSPAQGYNTSYTVATVPSATQFTVTIANGTTGAASARMYVGGTLQATGIVCDATGIATVTTASAHGLSAGNTAAISGASILPCNGSFTVLTAADSTHFTYAVTPIGTMRATGGAGGTTGLGWGSGGVGIGLTSLSGNGTTATAVTSAAHFFTTGQTVTVSNVNPAGYNGSFVVTVPSVNPTSITSAGTTATVTTPTPHGFLAGQTIVVTGASIPNHNGKFTIASAATPTTFTYAITSQSGTSSAATIKNLNVFTYSSATTGQATGTYIGAGTLDRSQSDQVTTLSSPVAVDGNTQVGVLYLASNGPSQFDAVLSFSNGSSITSRLVANDWFGTQSDPAVLSGQPVVFQKRVTHPKSAPIQSLVGDGTNLVASLATPQPFAVNDTVTISGASDPNHNGAYVITAVGGPTNTILTTTTSTAGILGDGVTAVVTTTAAHSFVAGDRVVITGTANGLYSGVFTVLASPAPTSTTFAIASGGFGASSGGTVVKPTFTVANSAPASTSTGTMMAVNNAATFVTYHAVQNTDAANLQVYNTTNAGPNLNLTEAIITLPASVAGSNLTGITFRNAAWGTTSLTGLTGNGTTATATLASTTGYIVGQAVTIRSAVPATFNGTFTIASIPDATHFTFANTTSGTATTNGTVERPGTGKGYSIYAATVRTGVANQPNAACANATVVTTASNIANVATDNFLSGSSPAVVTANDTSAVWFQYTAPASGTIPLLFSTCTSSFDTTIAVYNACGGALVASNDDTAGCGTGGSRVQFIATNSQTYFIRVAGKAGAKGTFTLHVEDFAAPANGSPATAQSAIAGLGSSGDTPGTVASAFDGAPSTCGGGTDLYGVWYTYTATGNNMIEARTCLDGQDATLTPLPQVTGATGVRTVSASSSVVVLPLDTTISIFTGTPSMLTQIACNDDGCNVSSRVQWSATASTVYYIRVASKSPQTGTNAQFILHIDDPVHVDLTMPLQFNWNGICHHTSDNMEQTAPDCTGVNTPAGCGSQHENRCDLNGFRSIADRGLLFDLTNNTNNALNYGGTVGFQGIAYSLYNTERQSDMVHLGNRDQASANHVRGWLTGGCPANPASDNGVIPAWLGAGVPDPQSDPANDQTGPQTSSMIGLHAVFGANTKIGLLYHMSNVNTASGTTPQLGTFDVTLTFTDSSSVTVTVQCSDWFGGASASPYNQVLPAAGSSALSNGLEAQRILGIYHAVANTDRGTDSGAANQLKVEEAVISTQNLISQKGFDPTGKTLRNISFGNLHSATPLTLSATVGVVGNGTTATGTTTAAHGFQVGTRVLIENTSDPSFNGLWTVLTVPTTTTFTFSHPTANTSTGGTAVNQAASGVGIYAATLRDPASYNLTYPPSGTGTITPNQLGVGVSGLMKVTVSRGSGSPNNITSVTVDGSEVNLPSNFALNDSAQNGDVSPNDNVWSRTVSFPLSTPAGAHDLPFTVRDAQNRVSTGHILFTTLGPTGGIAPNSVIVGGTTKATVAVSNDGSPTPTITSVTVNGTPIGLSAAQAMLDNGTGGDVTPNNGVYSADLRVGLGTTPAAYPLAIAVSDASSTFNGTLPPVTVTAPVAAATPAAPFPGTSTQLSVNLTGATLITSVVVDTSSIDPGNPSTPLNDVGNNGDTASDSIWSSSFAVPSNAAGVYILPYTMTDSLGGTFMGQITVSVPNINNVGTISPGVSTINDTIGANEVHWLKFTLSSPVDAALLNFLDIDTEGSVLAPTNDTEIGLYDASGNLIATDDDDGSNLLSQLSFGTANPARPAVGTGVAYNGRDGATLAAGTYYLAYCSYNATFGTTNWAVTNPGANTGSFTIRIGLGTIPSGGVPTTFTDLGTIGTTPATSTQSITAGGVAWFKFVLASDINSSARTFLDIDTEGSLIPDTIIGLFRDDGSGTLVSTDNDDGSGLYSQLTYGIGTRLAVGDGLAYNGRDGSTLVAGTYYLAVAENSAAFGNNFVVAFTTGVNAADVSVRIVRGVQPPPVPVILTGPVNNPANGHDYYLYSNLIEGVCLTWADAEAAAVAQGGHLAAINDADENEWVRVNVLGFDGGDRRGWIGLNDAPPQTQGDYVWSNGDPVTYTNWSAGEPNNPTTEFYGEMLGASGLWNNLPNAGSANCNYAIVEVAAAVACCHTDGTCTFVASANCDGTAQGAGSTCSPNPCPQPEACCSASGCTVVIPSACSGTAQGAGSTCTPSPCPGACCCGSHCSITTAAACTGSGRAFVAAGVCTPFSLTAPCCRGDYNKNGGLPTVQDIFDFLSGYFSVNPCADTNDSGTVSVQDIFDFLSAYFGGC